MKKEIKINFTDFWHGFIKEDNYFFNLLSKKYRVVIDEKEPDILFFSCYGEKYLRYNCTRVFFTAENTRVDFSSCDYAFSFDFINRENHFRLPLYALYIEQKKMMPHLLATQSRMEIRKKWEAKKKFCCMVVSNPGSKKRINFYNKLNKVIPVDSGGRVLNNVGGPVTDKLGFIKDYKFVLAFENSSYPGYTTEKILEPFFTDCIPVYWGNKEISLDFNPHRFINYHDFGNEDKLIEHLVDLYNDNERAVDILMQPIFNNNAIPEYIDDTKVLMFLDKIVEGIGTRKTIASSYKKYVHIAKRSYNQGWRHFEKYYLNKLKAAKAN